MYCMHITYSFVHHVTNVINFQQLGLLLVHQSVKMSHSGAV